ncbi:hypothetical protein HMPREF1589_02347 [Escherichia coli 113290]|nr:hypothetical protein HMPREF1589_02347 [Escherichia coli 113290]
MSSRLMMTPFPWLWKTEGYIRFSNKISELKDTSPPASAAFT